MQNCFLNVTQTTDKKYCKNKYDRPGAEFDFLNKSIPITNHAALWAAVVQIMI